MAKRAASSGYDRLYAGGGFGYEAFRPYWREWVRHHYVEAFALRPYERVLDIPCGDGFWASLLDELGFDVSGVDLSRGGIEAAKRNHPRIPFAVGDAEQELPFAEASFDVVFSRGITHLHRADLFTDASFQMARNLMRYVRPGGLLLVSYYTKRDGSQVSRHAQHPVSDLVRLFEAAGDVFKVEVVDHYVQIGVQRREAPRLQVHPTSVRVARRWLARAVALRLRGAARRRFRGATRRLRGSCR